ncbi:uncharacterized protein LOC128155593 isoform X1 [Crassostrea angulata]|uniref:uncharacterized protein LOC128155593 isoform X1 n=2 Tax=Magallana angulata TaxID=2784310 RepID=UPI0022B1E39A|nr:uncharacterized protein LOC128155593 isoform X1 [Crassostrea angulata]
MAKKMFRFLFVILLTSIEELPLCFGQTEPIRHCLRCTGTTQTQLDSCIGLVECGDDKECYLNTTTLNDGTWIKTYGCAKRSTCGSLAGPFGKRDPASTSVEYCGKEICNIDIGHFQEPPTSPCGDLSASDCRDPMALKTICSDCETAEYCRKSCGLCHDHSNTWYENVVLFDYDVVHKTCSHSSTVSSVICQSISEQAYNVFGVVHNNYTINAAHTRKDYLILHQTNSYVILRFRTNGEPLTNLQLYACKTTGHGRVDVLLNNNTIQESYNGTFYADLSWQIHKLNVNQYQKVRNYTLVIRKDALQISYGHYWLSHVRLESVVTHHGHSG